MGRGLSLDMVEKIVPYDVLQQGVEYFLPQEFSLLLYCLTFFPEENILTVLFFLPLEWRFVNEFWTKILKLFLGVPINCS